MCSFRKNYSPLSDIISYTPPQLYTGKTWYVGFMSFDPASGKMKRKRYMLDRIKSNRERRLRAAEIIAALTVRLRNGWSPWVVTESNRGYILLSEALDKYLDHVNLQPRYKTRKTYTSNVNILRHYISRMVNPIKYVYQYNAPFVADFLDYLTFDREVSARTRNNYRGWCGALAGFFIERFYISENPVDKIKLLPEDENQGCPNIKRMELLLIKR